MLTITTPDGKKIQPIGEHPIGYTMFDRTGHYITTDLISSLQYSIPNFGQYAGYNASTEHPI